MADSKLFKLMPGNIYHFQFKFSEPKFYTKVYEGKTLRAAVFTWLNLDTGEDAWVRFGMSHAGVGKSTSAVMRLLDKKKGDKISISCREKKNKFGQTYIDYDIANLGYMPETYEARQATFRPAYKQPEGIVDIDDGGPNF